MNFLPGIPDPIDRPEIWPPTIELRRGPESVAEHLAALRHLAAIDVRAPYHRGRGIVTVGGGKYWPGIVVGIKLLRETGCTLPVEVWYRGSCEPVNAADVGGLGDVWLIDSDTLPHSNRVQFSTPERGGWEAKLHALSLTLFNEVLFLDADAYCVADPTPLFDLLYRSPVVFWEDLPRMMGCVSWPFVWPDGSAGVPTFQGGQFLIDLYAGWKTLALAHWLCQHSDYYFAHVYGDQDCWRVALAAGGGKYRCLGAADWEQPAFVCRHEGVPYVVHRCQSKMFAGAPGPRADALPCEARAWELFETLTA